MTEARPASGPRWASGAVLVAVALAGCSRTSPPPTPPPTQASATADATWVREQIARGELADRVGPEGLVWIDDYREIDDERRDPRADAEGFVRDARRRCGDDAVEAVASLQPLLTQKITALADAAVRCEEGRCVFAPMMEFDFEVVLEFAPSPHGPRLTAVHRRDPRSSEATTSGWVAEARARAAATRCPASGSGD